MEALLGVPEEMEVEEIGLVVAVAADPLAALEESADLVAAVVVVVQVLGEEMLAPAGPAACTAVAEVKAAAVVVQAEAGEPA